MSTRCPEHMRVYHNYAVQNATEDWGDPSMTEMVESKTLAHYAAKPDDGHQVPCLRKGRVGVAFE